MKLAAYLCRSRHGVFYFRWPIPNAPMSQQRLRISLQTRCPKRAGVLARHLASCGESLRLQVVGSSMRYDEIRTIVQGVLQQTLQRTIARLDNQGPLHKYNPTAEENARSILSAGAEDYWEMVGPEEVERTLARVTAFSGRPRAEIEVSKADVLELFRTGMLAYWNAVDDHRKKLQSVDLITVPIMGQKDNLLHREVTNDSTTLAEVVALYIKEQDRIGAWVERTRAKQEATLGVLVELVGSATPMASISKKNAQDVKAVLLSLPPNKNKNPLTRNLSLRDAAKVPGIESMSPVTLNAYIGAFHTFTGWAVNNGYANENPFEGMKVRSSSRAAAMDESRKALNRAGFAGG